jgi:hypothetical protein
MMTKYSGQDGIKLNRSAEPVEARLTYKRPSTGSGLRFGGCNLALPLAARTLRVLRGLREKLLLPCRLLQLVKQIQRRLGRKRVYI